MECQLSTKQAFQNSPEQREREREREGNRELAVDAGVHEFL